MLLAVGVVHLLAGGVVIPVDQLHPFGHQLELLGRNGLLGVVAAAYQMKEHIAPHHRGEAVLPADGAYLVQMAAHQGEAVRRAVYVPVPAPAQMGGLVHADMDAPAAEEPPAGADHVGD